MSSVNHKTRLIRVCAVSVALSIAFGSVSAFLEHIAAQDQKADGTVNSSKRMADGKQWTRHNLNVKWVEQAGQRRRRYYKLTKDGNKVLAAQRTIWQSFVDHQPRDGTRTCLTGNRKSDGD